MTELTENDIYKACIVLSIIGLGIIHVSHSYLEIQEADITEIDRTWMGNTVQVEGEVSSYTETENAAFFEIEDSTGKIDIVDFENRNISNQASVSGHVDVYQGNLQIVAEEIKNY